MMNTGEKTSHPQGLLPNRIGTAQFVAIDGRMVGLHLRSANTFLVSMVQEPLAVCLGTFRISLLATATESSQSHLPSIAEAFIQGFENHTLDQPAVSVEWAEVPQPEEPLGGGLGMSSGMSRSSEAASSKQAREASIAVRNSNCAHSARTAGMRSNRKGPRSPQKTPESSGFDKIPGHRPSSTGTSILSSGPTQDELNQLQPVPVIKVRFVLFGMMHCVSLQLNHCPENTKEPFVWGLLMDMYRLAAKAKMQNQHQEKQMKRLNSSQHPHGAGGGGGGKTQSPPGSARRQGHGKSPPSTSPRAISHHHPDEVLLMVAELPVLEKDQHSDDEKEEEGQESGAVIEKDNNNSKQPDQMVSPRPPLPPPQPSSPGASPNSGTTRAVGAVTAGETAIGSKAHPRLPGSAPGHRKPVIWQRSGLGSANPGRRMVVGGSGGAGTIAISDGGRVSTSARGQRRLEQPENSIQPLLAQRPAATIPKPRQTVDHDALISDKAANVVNGVYALKQKEDAWRPCNTAKPKCIPKIRSLASAESMAIISQQALEKQLQQQQEQANVVGSPTRGAGAGGGGGHLGGGKGGGYYFNMGSNETAMALRVNTQARSLRVRATLTDEETQNTFVPSTTMHPNTSPSASHYHHHASNGDHSSPHSNAGAGGAHCYRPALNMSKKELECELLAARLQLKELREEMNEHRSITPTLAAAATSDEENHDDTRSHQSGCSDNTQQKHSGQGEDEAEGGVESKKKSPVGDEAKPHSTHSLQPGPHHINDSSVGGRPPNPPKKKKSPRGVMLLGVSHNSNTSTMKGFSPLVQNPADSINASIKMSPEAGAGGASGALPLHGTMMHGGEQLPVPPPQQGGLGSGMGAALKSGRPVPKLDFALDV